MLTSDAKASFSTKAFSKMKRLRLLKLNYVQLTGGYKSLCNKLRWLCWHGFPLKFIPKDFSLPNVVAIDLQYSNLRHLWEDSRVYLVPPPIINSFLLFFFYILHYPLLISLLLGY